MKKYRYKPSGTDEIFMPKKEMYMNFSLLQREVVQPIKPSCINRQSRYLMKASLVNFVKEKIKDLGTSACPPYHLALVIGGTSAEATLKTVKEASAGYLDNLPVSGNDGGRAFRDLEWERRIREDLP